MRSGCSPFYAATLPRSGPGNCLPCPYPITAVPLGKPLRFSRCPATPFQTGPCKAPALWRSSAPAAVPLPLNWDRPHSRDVNSLSGRWGIYLRSGPHLWILRGTCVPLYHAKPGVPHGWFLRLYPASVSIRRIVRVRSAIHTMSRTMPTGEATLFVEEGTLRPAGIGEQPAAYLKSKGIGKVTVVAL